MCITDQGWGPELSLGEDCSNPLAKWRFAGFQNWAAENGNLSSERPFQNWAASFLNYLATMVSLPPIHCHKTFKQYEGTDTRYFKNVNLVDLALDHTMWNDILQINWPMKEDQMKPHSWLDRLGFHQYFESFWSVTICSRSVFELNFMQTIFLPFSVAHSAIMIGVFQSCHFLSHTKEVT